MNQHPHCEFEELRGDVREACSRFVRDEYAGVYSWLCRLTGCSNEAADLTQEAFTAFWMSLGRKRAHVSPRTWLYAIARNQWRKHCRDRRTYRSMELEQIEAPQPQWTPAEHDEFTNAVREAMAALSPELREAFSLRLWHEFDYAEIAAVQETSAALARWRCFRARQFVRARLRPWQDEGEWR